MAPRKKRTLIIARDHAFTKTIGSAKDDKPDPLSVAVAQANQQMEAEYSRPAAEVPEPPPAEAPRTAPERPPEAERDRAPSVPLMETTLSDAASEAAPDQETQEPAASPATEAEPKVAGAGAGAGAAASTSGLNISIFVPGDLVERAEKWAAAIHQPLKSVMRHSFSQLRPELLTELKTITAKDVHQDRGERIGYRLQSRLRFTPAEIADMEARLDPAGFGNLTSILNYYARNRFTAFLDERLADAGY